MARLYDLFLDALSYVAIALFVGIMVGIGLDVAGRYFFGQPITWMFEFVQHSLLGMLFLGIGRLTREHGHVTIDILLDAVPLRARRAMVIASMLVAGAVTLFVAFWAVMAMLDNRRRGVETIGIYPIPQYWLIAVIALGLLLTGIEFVRGAVTLARAPDAGPPKSSAAETAAP
jgi:TRAP-type C4-dicarboxylate transport system permease small subunit